MQPHEISNIDQYLATCKTMAQAHAKYYNILVEGAMPKRLASLLVLEFAKAQFKGLFHDIRK